MTEHHRQAQELYQLYKDEKKHEDRTRKMLDELERNAHTMQRTKLQLIEKVLDLQVKDEMTRMHRDGFSMTDVTARRVSDNARAKISNEVAANIDESRAMYMDGFMAELDRMVHMPDEEAHREVHNMVNQYVDPHIEMLRRQKKKNQPPQTLQSVSKAVSEVRQERREELKNLAEYRARMDATDRIRRVEDASESFKKDIGELSVLLHVTPQDPKFAIGKKEAEINDLRKLITQQRATEERLMQERQIQLGLIDTDQARMTAEVESVSQRLVVIESELETKELDLREMQESKAPGSGSWAANTMQLERDLSLSVEEEFQLRQENDEVRKALEALTADKTQLEIDNADSTGELSTSQQEFQAVLNRLEERLQGEKRKMYNVRDSEQEITRKINELRYRILHRRDDVRRQKRDLRSVMTATISQLALEDREQSRLMARNLELQKNAERRRAQADQHIQSLNAQLSKATNDGRALEAQISALAEELTNYSAARGEEVKDVRYTAAQLNLQIEQQIAEWHRIMHDTAGSMASITARIDVNEREMERTLKSMANYAITQEDLTLEGVDMGSATTEQLEQIREGLYSELSQRFYRETKYTLMIKLLQERQKMRGRGERVEPLSRNRRITSEQRRAKLASADRNRLQRTGTMSFDQMRSQSAARSLAGDFASPAAVNRSPSSVSSAQGTNAHSSEFRMMLINFIKKEIQPLYDTSQITKKRFIDVVARVSSWYLETHRPSSDLSEQNISEIVKKIQEVISWQDDERLKQSGRV